MTGPDTPTPETPATETSSRIPFVTDFMQLVRVLFSPGAVFEEQREKPAVWVPWLIVSLLMIAVAFLNMPFSRIGMRLAAEAQGRPLPASIETITTVSTVVMTPIVMLITIAVSAGVLYLVLLGSGGEVRFKGLMSVSTFVAILAPVQMALMVVVLHLRGPESIQSMADLQVSFGLDLLLPQDSSLPKFVERLLRGISPFSIWSLVLMAMGIRIVEKQTKAAAWTAAIVGSLVMLVVGAVMAGFGGAG